VPLVKMRVNVTGARKRTLGPNVKRVTENPVVDRQRWR
jgi:hypothetical protein